MFCENCGARLEEDAVFCEQCGQRVVQPENADNAAEGGTASSPSSGTNIKLSKKQIGIAATVLVVIIAAVIIKSNWSYTVKLNDFLKVEYSGYDTVGRAEVSLDTEKLNKKYSGKIKLKDADQDMDINIGDVMGSYLSYRFTEDFEDLSNGDEITVKWSDVPDSEISEKFNCKLKYEDAVFTVEGLEEVTQADPFEKVEVTFSGIAPNGRIEIENNNEGPFSDLRFYAEENGALSNGDEVKVKADGYYGDDLNKYLAEEYGVIASQTEKAYTVEGLVSYVSSKEQISEAIINELRAQTEDVITAVTAQWNERSKLKASEYTGYYLLTAKDMDNYGDKNRLYVVYKLTQSFTTDEDNPAVDFSYYYTVRFDDVMVNDKGECSVDLNNYHKCSDRFYRNFKAGSDHHDREYYTVGYETVDEFVQKCVSTNAESYKSETNIK